MDASGPGGDRAVAGGHDGGEDERRKRARGDRGQTVGHGFSFGGPPTRRAVDDRKISRAAGTDAGPAL
ncbi:MAG: hypothetical protein BroJett022_09530 [Actinomycetes bacterium]|nr:MAG: hypothetical protein BroJett022_09530 [Actinomycetes bacterium]